MLGLRLEEVEIVKLKNNLLILLIQLTTFRTSTASNQKDGLDEFISILESLEKSDDEVIVDNDYTPHHCPNFLFDLSHFSIAVWTVCAANRTIQIYSLCELLDCSALHFHSNESSSRHIGQAD